MKVSTSFQLSVVRPGKFLSPSTKRYLRYLRLLEGQVQEPEFLKHDQDSNGISWDPMVA